MRCRQTNTFWDGLCTCVGWRESSFRTSERQTSWWLISGLCCCTQSEHWWKECKGSPIWSLGMPARGSREVHLIQVDSGWWNDYMYSVFLQTLKTFFVSWSSSAFLDNPRISAFKQKMWIIITTKHVSWHFTFCNMLLRAAKNTFFASLAAFLLSSRALAHPTVQKHKAIRSATGRLKTPFWC